MQEYIYNFSKGFQVGLPPTQALRTGTEYLRHCHNLVVTQYGLEALEIPSPPTELAPEVFPFPQLLKTKHYTFWVYSQTLWLVENEIPRQLLSVPSWENYQIADFGEAVLFTCAHGSWLWDGSFIKPLDLPSQFSVCCNHKGQLLIANGELAVPTDELFIQGGHWVAWGEIGSLNFSFDLGSESGFWLTDTSSEVLAMHSLGMDVIVFCSNSVWKLTPTTTPVLSYSPKKLSSVGVLNGACVAGDVDTVVFLGVDRKLYSLAAAGALETLGYKKYLETLEKPKISYDAFKKYWWIAGENNCYVFSGTGLSSSSYSITTCARADESLVGYYYQTSEADLSFSTSMLSLDSRALKTITCLEADISTNAAEVFARVACTYSRDDVFFSTNIPVNNGGVCFPTAAGVEMSVQYSITPTDEFAISFVNIHYKNTDRTTNRTQRTNYATKT